MHEEPTNTDIMVKLNRMSDAQDVANSTIEQHAKALESLGIRVLDLEKWQIAFKAAENALANTNLSKNVASPDSAYVTINKDILKLIGQVVAVVSGLVGVIYYFISQVG